MNLLDKPLYQTYENQVKDGLLRMYKQFEDSKQSKYQVDLTYQIMASAVFSANIEGNSIDLNSFMNMQLAQIKFKPAKEIAEIENLIAAYQHAQTHPLTEKTMLQVHALLAKNLVEPFQQGAYRQTKSGVFSTRGLVYLAVEPEFVAQEMTRLFAEIHQLLTMSLSLCELFYFAALLHLRFVHIHPFIDGNGRTARLLEKWVMAHHLGNQAWQIPTEQYYKQQQSHYYQYLDLGVNYYELDYDRMLPFLSMVPESLRC